MSCDHSQVNQALTALLAVFKEAACSNDRDKTTLNRIELNQLIRTQLPFLIQPNFEKHFEDFFKCMEERSGSNVDFRGFMCLLATIVLCRDEELSQQAQ